MGFILSLIFFNLFRSKDAKQVCHILKHLLILGVGIRVK